MFIMNIDDEAARQGLVNYLPEMQKFLKLDKASIEWFEERRLFRYHFIESLILAQDERWRRA